VDMTVQRGAHAKGWGGGQRAHTFRQHPVAAVFLLGPGRGGVWRRAHRKAKRIARASLTKAQCGRESRNSLSKRRVRRRWRGLTGAERRTARWGGQLPGATGRWLAVAWRCSQGRRNQTGREAGSGRRSCLRGGGRRSCRRSYRRAGNSLT